MTDYTDKSIFSTDICDHKGVIKRIPRDGTDNRSKSLPGHSDVYRKNETNLLNHPVYPNISRH